MNAGTSMDKTPIELRNWLTEALTKLEIECSADIDIKPVDGDAGFRQYFRVPCSPSLIAVIAPPETEDNAQFCRVAQALREHGVHTPKIIAKDFQQGFMLIEDLGAGLLLAELNESSVEGLYANAMMTLMHIQQSELDYSIYPSYSEDKLLVELELFPQWFVQKLLGYSLNPEEQSMLLSLFELLCANARAQAQVVVHRDFHSRNLIPQDGMSLGVIDFQDAVIGPVAYDLVSLLRDCYIAWPNDRVEKWCLTYAKMAQEVGIIPKVNDVDFIQDFDWIGLQRHIKVLGTFARLSLRDGKDGYLSDLPLVVFYVRNILLKYAEFSNVQHWFESTLMPLIIEQPWWRELNPEMDSSLEAPSLDNTSLL